MTKINDIYSKAEQDVCKVLIRHHQKSREEIEQDLGVERSIQRHGSGCHQPCSPSYQDRLEKGEHTLTNTLEQKRRKKLNTPYPMYITHYI